jgi:lipoate-protein ligase A
MNRVFRLIVDPAGPAALNMARDEFLLESQKNPDALPALRFYSWDKKAYSAGYFQDVAKIAKRLGCHKEKIPVVRRITGGGLVAHGDDLTFSLALKYPNEFFSPTDVKDSYLKVNMALLTGLKEMFKGIDFTDCKSVPSRRAGGERICFDEPTCYDLTLGGRKVVGSSQRRSAGIILHQSAVFLGGDKKELIKKICEGFEKEWKIKFEQKPWSAEETATAKAIEASRYRSDDWAFLESSFLS